MWQTVLFFSISLCVSVTQTQFQPPDNRYLQINVNQYQLNVLANYQNETFQDEYQLQVSLRQNQQNLMDVSFQYQTQDLENFTQIQFSTSVLSIVEFNATNNTYYTGNGSVSNYPADRQATQWNYWRNESVVIDGVYVHVYSANTSDGVFTTRIHIAPKIVDAWFGRLTPNDVKIDFEIHNYPFVEEDTRLALATKIDCQSNFQNNWQNNIGDNSILIGDPTEPLSPFGSFSWNKTAEANGTLIPVLTHTAPPVYNEIYAYFTFLTPNNSLHSDIVWDPRVGIEYDTPITPISPATNSFCFITCGPVGIVLLVIVCLLAVVVVAAIILMFKNHRKRTYEAVH